MAPLRKRRKGKQYFPEMKYYVEVRKIEGKDRGGFALKSFKKGEVIEPCPVIRLTPRERKRCKDTVLDLYIYPWRSTRSGSVILGYGMTSMSHCK